jgi:hypothetical protein
LGWRENGTAASSSCPVVQLAVLAPVVGTVTAVLQVLAFSDVVGQVDRAFVGGHRFLASPELVKQVRARGSGEARKR